MEDQREYIGRRIAEEMRETRRVIMPWVNECSRIFAMELPKYIVDASGALVPNPERAMPPALQELCDYESERLKRRVAALQAGDVFPLHGEPRSATIG